MSDFQSFGDTAKGLSKNPLGIIALFIVLVYGFASLIIVFSNSLTTQERLPIIYFLVCFPVLVLGVFAWLVSRHTGKLYSPSDYRDEHNFIRVASALTEATIRRQLKDNKMDINKLPDNIPDKIAGAIKAAAPNSSASSSLWHKRILWVDDNPDNNIMERKAFEELGLKFSIAKSTNEALDMLRYNKFAAIISDMGRLEGPREGYVLLESTRKMGNLTPFFIYAGSNLPEHKREALEKGAQGSTNNLQELFVSVNKAIIDGATIR
ncbi:response regulator [Paenibacillus montanisoli]|uniref:Response regulator n=1 Tax=Paenibacillus montanisoli TaxID=2081970 RepID=A0A328UES5_9BACL|nr:response regulator [Paenibacillus montanisoli]RAP78466.1 response regulator [Paenibacillus montanisoli]